uniref:Uncharacterized protein n=1 Tax=Siphoviridae sp. ctquf9 TaxID=2826470 RepID=A0A8S5M4G9_9CAUD|nr:MAG TPA: hypothetical protein [Siphoviridae sp. ctquf9]
MHTGTPCRDAGCFFSFRIFCIQCYKCIVKLETMCYN